MDFTVYEISEFIFLNNKKGVKRLHPFIATYALTALSFFYIANTFTLFTMDFIGYISSFALIFALYISIAFLIMNIYYFYVEKLIISSWETIFEGTTYIKDLNALSIAYITSKEEPNQDQELKKYLLENYTKYKK